MPVELVLHILQNVALEDFRSFGETSKKHAIIADLAFLPKAKEFYFKCNDSSYKSALEAKNFLRNLCQDVQNLRECIPKKYRVSRKISLNPFSTPPIKPLTTLKKLHSIDSAEIFSLFQKASKELLPQGHGLFLAKYLLHCTEQGIIETAELIQKISKISMFFALKLEAEEDLSLFTLLLAHGGDPTELDMTFWKSDRCVNLLGYAARKKSMPY